MIDLPAHPDRSSTIVPSAAGRRLPARLRGRRTLVIPPAPGSRGVAGRA